MTQAFRNTSNRWVEASYLYPLPEGGAVDTLKMVVGQRVIVGKIKRREDAQKIYDKAMKAGRKASLVEQQRPNMFTNRVANIGPGETILIQIEYQAPVRQAGGTFSLRLPLVVGPRYVPPHTLVSNAAVRDAATITASPIARPIPGRMLNPVSIAVHLTPGFIPAALNSPYHRIAVDGAGGTRNIRLSDGQVPADRDFELDWRAASNAPEVGAFKQQVGRQTYVMATVVPPVAAALPETPREMVFVIDNSGSMGGSSMEEAKASLEHALRTLRPQDHFNVIRFDDSMTQLFEHSVPATREQVDVALRFARSLEASGGTEMLPALKAALADAATVGDSSTVRQIIFLTDGDISNEEEMAAAIAADQGRSHLFPVGIGSAPNNYLMARMANMGRGTYTNIGSGRGSLAEDDRRCSTRSAPGPAGRENRHQRARRSHAQDVARHLRRPVAGGARPDRPAPGDDDRQWPHRRALVDVDHRSQPGRGQSGGREIVGTQAHRRDRDRADARPN